MPAPFTNTPVTFLAPMQDITDAGFMEIVKNRGAPDFYIAEYFRIHEFFELDPHVLNSVLWSPDCVSAQFIGEDESFIARAIDELKKYPQINPIYIVTNNSSKIWPVNIEHPNVAQIDIKNVKLNNEIFLFIFFNTLKQIIDMINKYGPINNNTPK